MIFGRPKKKMFTEANNNFEINYNVCFTFLQNDSVELKIIIIFYKAICIT